MSVCESQSNAMWLYHQHQHQHQTLRALRPCVHASMRSCVHASMRPCVTQRIQQLLTRLDSVWHTSYLSPLTSHLSPLTTHHSPLTTHFISYLSSLNSPLTSHLSSYLSPLKYSSLNPLLQTSVRSSPCFPSMWCSSDLINHPADPSSLFSPTSHVRVHSTQ